MSLTQLLIVYIVPASELIGLYVTINWIWVCWLFRTRTYNEAVKQTVDILAETNIIYVKMLQTLASNKGTFSKEFDSAVARFTDNVPYTFDDLDNEFMTTIHRNDRNDRNDRGESVDPKTISHEPVKSGSVALVYDALLYNGTHVAIKVLRRNIRQRIIRSMRGVDLLVDTITRIPFVPHYSLSTVYRENKELMVRQTDMTLECSNIERFYNANIDWPDVIIPKVYKEYTAQCPDMIVMDWIEGFALSDIDPTEYDMYANIFYKAVVKSILCDSLYHGDLHMGNVLFAHRADGTPIIGFIDFGIVNEVSAEDCEQLTRLTEFIRNEDVSGLTRFIVDGIIVYDVPLARTALVAIEQRLHTIVCVAMKNGTLCVTDLGSINNCLSRYSCRLSPNFYKLQVALAVAIGIIRQVNGSERYIERVNETVASVIQDMIDAKNDRVNREGVPEETLLIIRNMLGADDLHETRVRAHTDQ